MINEYLYKIQLKDPTNESIILGTLLVGSIALLLKSIHNKYNNKQEIQRVIQIINKDIKKDIFENREYDKLYILGKSLYDFLNRKARIMVLLWNNYDSKRQISKKLLNKKLYQQNTIKIFNSLIKDLTKEYYHKGNKLKKDLKNNKIKYYFEYFSDGDSPFNLSMNKNSLYDALGKEDSPYIFKQVDIIYNSIELINKEAMKILVPLFNEVVLKLSKYT